MSRRWKALLLGPGVGSVTLVLVVWAWQEARHEEPKVGFFTNIAWHDECGEHIVTTVSTFGPEEPDKRMEVGSMALSAPEYVVEAGHSHEVDRGEREPLVTHGIHSDIRSYEAAHIGWNYYQEQCDA
jgi:hypothetical protein